MTKVILLEVQTEQANQELKEWIEAAVKHRKEDSPAQQIELIQVHVQQIQSEKLGEPG